MSVEVPSSADVVPVTGSHRRWMIVIDFVSLLDAPSIICSKQI